MVHTQPVRRILIRTVGKATLMAVLAGGFGMGMIHPRPARAQTDPDWQDLVDTYAAEYPAVYTDYDVETTIHADFKGVSFQTKYRIQLAVFDVKRAQDYVNLVIPYYRARIKNKRAWVIEEGSGASRTEAEGGDFHERTIFGQLKELRISFPGLREKGFATVELETQGQGGSGLYVNYTRDIPVKKGTYTVLGEWSLPVLYHGDMHKVSGTTYEFDDVPARFTDPKVPESSQPKASICVGCTFGNWKDIADGFAEGIDDIDIPKDLIKSVQDTLKDASPLEAVEGLARFLDDPTHLQLIGSARSGVRWSDPDEAVKTQQATAFTKAVLAYRLLRALKIHATLVLASSRFLTSLDWRNHSFSQIDATLVWVPDVSEDFLWDVAARWVPFGMGGSDLYPEMLVLDPRAMNATHDFGTDPIQYREDRSLDLELGDSGAMNGDLSCRFMSYPLESGLDPWASTVDLDKKLEAIVPTGVEVSGAEWKQAGPRSMRCSPETPAVLEGHLTEEAQPAGEAGWDVAPFILSLPRELAVLGDPDRKAPLLLNDSYAITDSVRVNIGDHNVVQLPEPETLRTRAGDFNTTWEQGPDGVMAVRRLSVDGSVMRLQDESSVARLCKAWRESQTQTIRVD